MDTRIKLKELFWGAGTRFKWGTQFSDKVGFGVKSNLLEGGGNLIIEASETGKWGYFSVPKAVARDYCMFWGSYKIAVRDTKLAIIPRALCSQV